MKSYTAHPGKEKCQFQRIVRNKARMHLIIFNYLDISLFFTNVLY